MASFFTWARYLTHKLEYSAALLDKQIKSGVRFKSRSEAFEVAWKTFNNRLTYLHWNKGVEMSPTIGEKSSLLIRKLPVVDPRNIVSVGDVVVLKNPVDSDDFLVRRLAAVEGYEMASKDEKDESFVLEKDECWVLADNESLKPKEANDSRIFGPVPMTSIVGRVIYCLRNAVDHGPVQNSPISSEKDFPVLQVELDVEEMARNQSSHKG